MAVPESTTATAPSSNAPAAASATPAPPTVAKPPVKKAAAKKSPAKKKKAAAKRAPAARYNAPVYAAIVIDATTGQVLSEVNADTKGYPASLTKMMTLYMLFEALERGEISMNSLIPVSPRAMAAAPSKLHLTKKSKLTVEQAIGALITKSANDVAVATAEFLGGTESQFAAKMTARARELGMSQTTFMNASGLPNPGQLSSVRDMSLLANRLIKDYPQHYAHFSKMEFLYQGQTIRTHNRLLEFYEGADGIKTGFTAASGFNLAGSATRNGYRVIGVIFGGTSSSSRDRKLAELMDQGFTVLSGQPDMAIAGRAPAPSDRIADTIGQQIALGQGTQDATEQGDRDAPFTPTTRQAVTTTALAPLPQAGAIAALSPQVKPALPQARKTDEFESGAGIQIGAYSTRVRAEAQAFTAVQSLKTTYTGATAVVMPVKINGRLVYRARVMGLDGTDLVRACSLVPKAAKAGACQAVRSEGGQLASN
jgi:D-alanyl-D-alanine carboxypeptidase